MVIFSPFGFIYGNIGRYYGLIIGTLNSSFHATNYLYVFLSSFLPLLFVMRISLQSSWLMSQYYPLYNSLLILFDYNTLLVNNEHLYSFSACDLTVLFVFNLLWVSCSWSLYKIFDLRV